MVGVGHGGEVEGEEALSTAPVETEEKAEVTLAEVIEDQTPDLSDLSSKLKAELIEITKTLELQSSGTKQDLLDRIYESMSVAQLKDLLRQAGKPVSGKKADLISRLSE